MGTINNPVLSQRPAGKIVFNGTTYYKPRTPSLEALLMQKLDRQHLAVMSDHDESSTGYKIKKPNRSKVFDRKIKKEVRSRKNRAYAL